MNYYKISGTCVSGKRNRKTSKGRQRPWRTIITTNDAMTFKSQTQQYSRFINTRNGKNSSASRPAIVVAAVTVRVERQATATRAHVLRRLRTRTKPEYYCGRYQPVHSLVTARCILPPARDGGLPPVSISVCLSVGRSVGRVVGRSVGLPACLSVYLPVERVLRVRGTHFSQA